MSNWKELTDLDGKRMLINLDHAYLITPEECGGCSIFFDPSNDYEEGVYAKQDLDAIEYSIFLQGGDREATRSYIQAVRAADENETK